MQGSESQGPGQKVKPMVAQCSQAPLGAVGTAGRACQCCGQGQPVDLLHHPGLGLGKELCN